MTVLEISIKKNELKKIGMEVTEYSEEFENNIKKFNAIIDNINTVWNGIDAIKYINIMKEKYVVGMNELCNTIKKYGDYIEKVPDAYSALDEVFSSKKIDV